MASDVHHNDFASTYTLACTNKNHKKEESMKKILTLILALAFAGVMFAQEPAKTETKPAEPVKTEAKTTTPAKAKKVKKVKKAKKVVKEEKKAEVKTAPATPNK